MKSILVFALATLVSQPGFAKTFFETVQGRFDAAHGSIAYEEIPFLLSGANSLKCVSVEKRSPDKSVQAAKNAFGRYQQRIDPTDPIQPPAHESFLVDPLFKSQLRPVFDDLLNDVKLSIENSGTQLRSTHASKWKRIPLGSLPNDTYYNYELIAEDATVKTSLLVRKDEKGHYFFHSSLYIKGFYHTQTPCHSQPHRPHRPNRPHFGSNDCEMQRRPFLKDETVYGYCWR